jgi:hypothetical protein
MEQNDQPVVPPTSITFYWCDACQRNALHNFMGHYAWGKHCKGTVQALRYVLAPADAVDPDDEPGTPAEPVRSVAEWNRIKNTARMLTPRQRIELRRARVTSTIRHDVTAKALMDKELVVLDGSAYRLTTFGLDVLKQIR